MPLLTSVSTPELLEGDSMTSDEFLRRWEEIPDLKHAELIDGIVYMPSLVDLGHQDVGAFLAGWLGNYACATPGCRPASHGTWLMGERQVPEPDVTLRIAPEFGGQSRVEGEFPAGAPEFLAEVAVSSRSRDFGIKKRLYERAGVLEYLIAVPVWQEISWFERTASGFQPVEPGADRVFRSRCFPGLWLDVQALWDLDLAKMNEVLQQGLATPEHAAFVARLAGRKPPAAPR
jgi:Uma2 family endonuclease